MPFPRIEPAARKDIKGRTGGNGDVRDDEAGLMDRQSVVNGIGKHIEAVVEEEDQEKYNER